MSPTPAAAARTVLPPAPRVGPLFTSSGIARRRNTSGARCVPGGLWTGTSSAAERDFLTAVFSLRLRCTLRRCGTRPLSPSIPVHTMLRRSRTPLSRLPGNNLFLETPVVMLGWRYSRYDPARIWSVAQAAAVHDASCQRVLALLAHRRTLDARAPSLHAHPITDLKEVSRRSSGSRYLTVPHAGRHPRPLL
jgi:hypothetical protein